MADNAKLVANLKKIAEKHNDPALRTRLNATTKELECRLPEHLATMKSALTTKTPGNNILFFKANYQESIKHLAQSTERMKGLLDDVKSDLVPTVLGPNFKILSTGKQQALILADAASVNHLILILT